jgi:flagellar basal-body rod protein FlgB
MLQGIELFRLTGDRMHWLTQRQTVLARNIANADTPHYRAQDLSPFTFDSLLLKGASGMEAGAAAPLRLARTEGAHFGDDPGSTVIRTDPHSGTYGEKPDGNTVSLEEQMVKTNDVANAFQLATAAYTTGITLLKTAIDNGK